MRRMKPRYEIDKALAVLRYEQIQVGKPAAKAKGITVRSVMGVMLTNAQILTLYRVGKLNPPGIRKLGEKIKKGQKTEG